jgi:hypothetical protein
VSLVLIHHDHVAGPVGVWRIVDGRPDSYYPTEHTALEKRARAVLNARGNDVGWDAWMRRLAYRIGHLDDYTVRPDDGTPLADVLADERAVWDGLRRTL